MFDAINVSLYIQYVVCTIVTEGIEIWKCRLASFSPCELTHVSIRIFSLPNGIMKKSLKAAFILCSASIWTHRIFMLASTYVAAIHSNHHVKALWIVLNRVSHLSPIEMLFLFCFLFIPFLRSFACLFVQPLNILVRWIANMSVALILKNEEKR